MSAGAKVNVAVGRAKNTAAAAQRAKQARAAWGVVRNFTDDEALIRFGDRVMQGASLGSAGGPYGAIIGAVVGLITAMVETIMGGSADDRFRRELDKKLKESGFPIGGPNKDKAVLYGPNGNEVWLASLKP